VTDVKIRLDQFIDGPSIQEGIVVDVTSFSPELRSQRLVLSSGTNAAPGLVEVEPGTLLVQARLPSGELLVDRREIGSAKEEIILRPSPSSREWLGWANFLASGSRLVESFESSLDQPLDPELERLLLASEVLQQRRSAKGELETTSRSCIEWVDSQRGHRAGEGSVVSFELLVSSLEGDRAFLRVMRSSEIWLLALPLPWNGLTGPVPVQLLLDAGTSRVESTESGDQSLEDLPIGIIVKDPQLGSSFGYLRSQDQSSLSAMHDQIALAAEQALFDKAQNPLAAAAGAYLLIRMGLLERLHTWPSNLCARFEWLPDGAIIEGWQLLMKQDLEAAARRFELAAARGIPAFTAGARLLYQAKLRLGRRFAERASAWVDELASVIHPNRIYTSIVASEETCRRLLRGNASPA
jgi:hypothetical protein